MTAPNDLTDRGGSAAGPAAPAGADDWDAALAAVPDDPAPLYPDAPTWVAQYLSLLVCRQLGAGATWCAQWWRHAEAVSRLEALWRAWETLRLEPALGMSTWWRDHADHHLAVLLSRDSGPFAGCTTERHTDLPPLPTTPAPGGWWGVPDDDPVPDNRSQDA